MQHAFKPEWDSDQCSGRGGTFYTRNNMLVPQLKCRVLVRSKDKDKLEKMVPTARSLSHAKAHRC